MKIQPCPHPVNSPFKKQKESGYYLKTQGEQKAIINEIEEILESDVISYYGYIHEDLLENFYEILKDGKRRNKLTLILFTPGGFSQNLKSFSPYNLNYSELVFIIPERAASAGTIWALSGTEVYFMEDSKQSPLTKIDPSMTGQFDNIQREGSCIQLLNHYYGNSIRVEDERLVKVLKNSLEEKDADKYCRNYVLSIENILEVIKTGSVIQNSKFDLLLNALLNFSLEFRHYKHTDLLPQKNLKEMGLSFKLLNELSRKIADKTSTYNSLIWEKYLIPRGKNDKLNSCLIQNRDYYVE